MNKKVVFLDVDGTLVNTEGVIPTSAKKAIAMAQENGHEMVVCSGRSLFQMQKELLDLGFRGIVASAGAMVLYKDELIYHAKIDATARKEAVEYLDKNDVIYYFQAEDGIVTTQRNKERMLDFAKKLNLSVDYLEQFLGTYFIVDDLTQSDKGEKMIYFGSPISVEQMHEDMLPYFDVVSMSMPGSDATCGEIGIAGINKATAMELYLNHVGVSKEDCVAVGDGPNDFEMMDYAGISVAMGNAVEEVKKRADMVTTDINEDGIYKAFEKLGLI